MLQALQHISTTSRLEPPRLSFLIDYRFDSWLSILTLTGYALNIVRSKNTLATFLAVLAVAVGVPEGYASQSVATAHAQRSAPDAIRSWVLQENSPLAETTTSRDGTRTRIAAASRPNPLHGGIAPVRVVPPSLGRLGTVVRASGAPTASAPFPASLVRGPPLAI
jgi:hypothetical protein